MKKIFNKKTLILGASPNPNRYAFLAANRLIAQKHAIVLLGKTAGKVQNHTIWTDFPPKPILQNLHTTTLYLQAKHQKAYYDLIIENGTQRIIFNPGAENNELAQLAQQNDIEVVDACTLVMLSTGLY